MYQFTDDCLIGVDQIDNEHRRLFELVNEAANLLMREDLPTLDLPEKTISGRSDGKSCCCEATEVSKFTC